MIGKQHMSAPSGRNADTRQPERLPQPCTAENSAPPRYRLRGRFVSGRTFYLSPDIVDQMTREPEPAPRWPRWYSGATFIVMSIATLFTMCALGRPGA